MKWIIILMLFLCPFVIMRAELCFPSGITFTSQAQLDSFAILYPECTELGSITVEEGISGDITSLAGLMGINAIGAGVTGRISIRNNAALRDLIGLDSITTLSGAFVRMITVENNLALHSLEGLHNLQISNLTAIRIMNNPQLRRCSFQNIVNMLNTAGTVFLDGNTCDCNKVEDIIWLLNPEHCLPCGLLASSQDQIDSFPVRNPGCKIIGGEVRIEEESPGAIMNLSGLLGVEEVDGRLLVLRNDGLIDLRGLDSLKWTDSNFEIEYNNNLINLRGLESLVVFPDNLYIANNNSLQSLTGLDSLREIALLRIASNNSLSTLTGLAKLRKVNVNLNIAANQGLQSLTGLENLLRVDGALRIANNDALTDLTALSALKSIGRYSDSGSLTISGNASLETLHGLDSVSYLEGGSLDIANNPLLHDISALNSIRKIGGHLKIINNDALQSIAGLQVTEIGRATGGNLIIEDNDVLLNLQGLNNLVAIWKTSVTSNGNIYIRNNTSLQEIQGLTSLEEVERSIHIEDNPALISFNGMGVQSVDDLFIVRNNNALENLLGLEQLSYIGDRLWIENNDALIDLQGLGLEKIGDEAVGELFINNNASLETLDGLENLTILGFDYWPPLFAGVEGKLIIQDNPVLSDISGIVNLENGLTEVTISNNSNLSNCAVASLCTALSASSASFTIFENGTGCDSPFEVLFSCSAPPAICSWDGSIGFWNEPARWDCGRVPRYYDAVIIPQGEVTIPTGTNLAACRSIALHPDSHLLVRSGSLLRIYD